MSATATALPPATAADGTPVSPADYVRGLSPEDKQVVFLTLLREALQLNGDTGLLPVEDEDGKPFGYYVPPKVAAERADALLPKITPEREAELARRRAVRTMLSEDELRAWLRQAEPVQS